MAWEVVGAGVGSVVAEMKMCGLWVGASVAGSASMYVLPYPWTTWNSLHDPVNV